VELVAVAPLPVAPIVCFGECMIELSRAAPGDIELRRAAPGNDWAMGFAGDTYNVAAYLKRLGEDVGYMTALGNDHFSAAMRAAWAAEGIGSDLALTHASRTPGLYAIILDASGERSFAYWRDQSAARGFFDCSGAEALLARVAGARLLYVSGITLSLFDDAGRRRIAALAATIRDAGGDVVFDSNYRARGWDSPQAARAAIAAFAPQVTIALPTLDDDRAVFGDADAEACAARWLAWGAREVAVKLGAAGAHVATRSSADRVAPAGMVVARDTTGAGDSFNAAYIAARRRGMPPAAAAAAGNWLAATVVQHAGAIIDKRLMPAGLVAQ
jgi:2-dehydro-3-deoxygluconokinase